MKVPSSEVKRLPKERESLVLDNLRLVDHIIQKQLHISPYDNMYDDYRQEGRFGLIKAAIAFDEDRGIKFSTFAGSYIQGYARRFRREFARSSMKVPRSILDLIPKIMKLYYDGYTYTEIQNKLNLSYQEISDVLNASEITHLESIIGLDADGKSLAVIDVIASPDNSIVDALGEDVVEDAIQHVANSYKNPTHKEIWYEYAYPAYYGERIRETSLANKYGLSQSYINRIIGKGKKLLKEYLV
jgi:DNA-directed RNA polymerase specialized sigma subunit